MKKVILNWVSISLLLFGAGCENPSGPMGMDDTSSSSGFESTSTTGDSSESSSTTTTGFLTGTGSSTNGESTSSSSSDAESSSSTGLDPNDDPDGDGYINELELIAGTDPFDADSDDDGIWDGAEDTNKNGVVDGNESDPLNPASRTPYYCDGIRFDNDGDGIDFPSNCINRELFSAGDRHVCLIMRSGVTRCWGRNQFRQLGVSGEDRGDDETAADGGTSLSGLIQVSAGGSTTCGLLSGGTVRCWGRGSNGVTGQGHENQQTFSGSNVDLPEPAIQVSTSGNHTCAVTEAGNLYCWGNNSQGNLGYENTEDIGDNEFPASAGLVQVGGPVKQVSVGSSFTCVLYVDAFVRCWGFHSQGQLGLPIDLALYGGRFGDQEGETPESAIPVTLGGGSVQEIYSGLGHTCAVSNGAFTCWGQGAGGKLGHGNTENIGDDELASDHGSVPYGGGDITNVATGLHHTCVTLASGSVRCWGEGFHGALGYGNTENIGDDEIASQGGDIDLGDKHAVYTVAGNRFTCSLMSDDSVHCWGLNDVGQLGLGHTDTVMIPTEGEVDYQ